MSEPIDSSTAGRPLAQLGELDWIHSFYDPTQHRTQQATPCFPASVISGLLTQNVRGFRDQEQQRATWFSGWKSTVDGRKVDCILLQETHVTSQAEADELASLWCRGWGKVATAGSPLSFWSVTTERRGGVAILLHPRLQGRYQLETTHDPGRFIRLGSQDSIICNVYAPNQRQEREEFYRATRTLLAGESRAVWLAGDFNCVLSPEFDRVTAGKAGRGREESKELHQLTAALQLEDAQDSSGKFELNRITYWQGDSGARLDRCYVSRKSLPLVLSVATVTPHGPTDHRGVLVWRRDRDSKPVTRKLEPNLYPVAARNPAVMEKTLGLELGTVMCAAAARDLDWDTTIGHVKDSLLSLKRLERKRARRQLKRMETRQRKKIVTLRDLIEYVHLRAERKTRQKRGRQLLERSGNSAHLFKRFVQIDQRRPIPTLVSDEAPPNASVSQADVMAAAWRPLLCTTHATVTPEAQRELRQQLYTIPEQHKLTKEDNVQLMQPITEEEVAATIKSLGAHKAAGPDRLSNDFYRDWGDLMVPRLATEFNSILSGHEMPESFSKAIIVPLDKAGDRTNATNYRPISLLQSSYKIFTKLMAHRVQRSLGKVINADQNGFVRGRALANNITIMQAILDQPPALASAPTAADNAAVVLLDFKKAYDTLDRDFVASAMEDFGYSAAFVALVRRLHVGTTAQFLVNGELSEHFEVVTGIRQGCPLAPLLFLIAVEPLKHAIDQAPWLSGIQLQHRTREYEHIFSAFVDDSVVFLDRGDMIPALEAVLDTFAAISGLQVQPHKSHVIILNTGCIERTIGSFPIVPVGTTVTYLGVEIGLADLDQVNWEKRCGKIEKQLGVLSQYTTGVTDRVQIINMASIPSLLFTAQFFTPPRRYQLRLEGIWRQFVWNGTITGAPRQAHKIAKEIVQLPRHCGGLGLRDYGGAMKAQAATAIVQWNGRSNDKYWAAFDKLLRSKVSRPDDTIMVYPSVKPVPATALQTGRDLLEIGLLMVNAALSARYPHPAGLRSAKISALADLQEPWSGLRWETTQSGSIRLREREPAKWTALAQLNYAQTPTEIKMYWATFPWADNSWIRGPDGEVLRVRDYPFIRIRTLAALSLERVDDLTYRFRNPAGPVETMHQTTRRQLAIWLTVIIANFAALPGKPPLHSTDRVFGASRHSRMDAYEWHLTSDQSLIGTRLGGAGPAAPDPTRGQITATVTTWREPLRFVSATPSASQDLDALQAINMFIDGHPRLHQGPLMRSATDTAASLCTPQAIVKKWVSVPTAETEAGLLKLVHRLEKQLTRHPVVGSALQTTTIRQLAAKPWGVSSQQHFLRYRLTLGALNVRDLTGHRMPCPLSFCSTQDVFCAEHVMWTCTAAQTFWQTVFQRWASMTTTTHTVEDAARHIFEPSPPPLNASTRHALHELSAKDSVITATITAVWRVISFCATQQLWLLRNTASFTAAAPNSIEHTRTVLAAVRNQLTALSSVKRVSKDEIAQGRIIQVLTEVLTTARESDASPTDTVRLYFDGGSRGNPGITGSGSVLLEREDEVAEWRIVWCDAHYLGDDSTNNVAEHTAAMRGLAEASRRYKATKQHVIIIGDSQLVIAQLNGVARVRHHAIQALVHRSRSFLRDLQSYELQHTLRNGNKMADRLANWAMDERRTYELAPDDTALLSDLNGFLLTDTTAQWSSTIRPNRLLPQVQTKLQEFQTRRPTRKRRHWIS